MKKENTKMTNDRCEDGSGRYLLLREVSVLPTKDKNKLIGKGYISVTNITKIPGRFSVWPTRYETLEKALEHITDLYGDQGNKIFEDKLLLATPPKQLDLEGALNLSNPYVAVLERHRGAKWAESNVCSGDYAWLYGVYKIASKKTERFTRRIASVIGKRNFRQENFDNDLYIGVELNLPKLVRDYINRKFEDKINYVRGKLNSEMNGDIK